MMDLWGRVSAQGGAVAPSERLGLEDPLGVLQGRWLDFVAYLPRIAIALLIVAVVWWASRWIGRLERPYRRLSINPLALNLLRQTVRVGFLVAGLLLALDVLEATALVGAVLGTAGVVGLAIGFAFKDLVENYIAGVLLSLRQPFSPLDFVDVGGHQGKVMRLTSRATILMTADGNHLRLPNSLVFKAVITNYSRAPNRRFDFPVGVGVGEDLALAQQLGTSVLAGMDGVLDDPGVLTQIEELGDSTVTLRFYGWIDQRSHSFMKVKSEAIRQVKEAFDGAGVEMPEPTYRVSISDRVPATEDAETNRPRRSARSAETVAPMAPDLSVDRTLDRQIVEEQAAESPTNLLNSAAPRE